MYKKQRGFGLVEIMVVISIMGILVAIVTGSFSGALNHYEIQRVTRGVSVLLEKARSFAVYSKDASKYGIYLESDQATLFRGSSYTAGDPTNEVFDFGSKVTVASTSLALNQTTIVFDRITGKTLNSGNIILWISSATTSSSTISVGKTGIIEVR